MKLHFNTTSPFVRKVRVLAREANLMGRIEEVPTTVSPLKLSPDYAQLNPLGKVPTLVLDDGSALFDSPVICEYLDGLHGGRKLIPPGGPARWTALRLQALGDGIVDVGSLCRVEVAIRPESLRWPEWIAGHAEKWHAAVDRAEAEVAAIAGEPTIGTIAVACALGWLDFRFAQDDWRPGHPQLARWYAEFSARPSMQDTMPKA
jgi:glutathione S-transferase